MQRQFHVGEGLIAMLPQPPLLIQVITRLIVGGAQLTVLGLCESLREHFDVRIICGPDEGAEGSLRNEMEALVPVLVLPELHRDISPLQDIAAMRALKRVFLRDTPTIIHTHSSKAGILGRMAAPRPSAKVVHTIHGWGHTPDDPWWKREVFVGLERIAFRRTDALIAVSEDVRDEGCRLGIAESRDYHVIPEFVDYRAHEQDFSASRRQARQALGLSPTVQVLGWVGRFVPQKDPGTLVDTLHTVLIAQSELRAVLIGDGPLRLEVERQISEFGLSDRVVFAGLRKDARQLLAAFDVVLHVSRWEGQPRVVQESIAERVPVVATRVSGLTDIVIPGRTGYLVEPGDARGLADRLLCVLNRPDLRAPLPQSVIDEVAQHNGHEGVLTRHLRLYAQLLTGQSHH
jgi:glycosyltransferase involved in cell wall biosynthesis